MPFPLPELEVEKVIQFAFVVAVQRKSVGNATLIDPLPPLPANDSPATGNGLTMGVFTPNGIENKRLPLSNTRTCQTPVILLRMRLPKPKLALAKQRSPETGPYVPLAATTPSGVIHSRVKESLVVTTAPKYTCTVSVVANEFTAGGTTQPESGGAVVVTIGVLKVTPVLGTMASSDGADIP